MGNLVLDNNLLAMITSLAERFKTTKEDIVKKAVRSYEKNVTSRNHLMDFAGILEEEEAQNILNSIYNNRQDKETTPGI